MKNAVKIRIEGEPARIQVWLNGVQITDFQHTEETTEDVPKRVASGCRSTRGRTGARAAGFALGTFS